MKRIARKTFCVLLIALFSAQNCFCLDLSDRAARNSDKLAPHSLFQSSFAREDSPEYKNSVISDITLTTVLFSIAFNYLEDRPESTANKDLGVILRNEFRNHKPALNALNEINLDNVKFDEGIVTIPLAYRGKNYSVRICSKDHFASVDTVGSEWALSGRFAIQAIEVKLGDGESVAEPLIGHGFTAHEIDEDVAKGKIVITPWNQSPGFVAAVEALEKILREDAPRLLPQVLRGNLFGEMLAKLEAFKSGGENGYARHMGTCKSRYVDAHHYYAGLGTARNAALGEEYFTPGDPLSEFAVEALFHEIFQAVRSDGNAGRDPKDDIFAHFDAMRYQAILFWGVESTPESIAQVWGLKASELKYHEKNRHGKTLSQWKIKESRVPERMAQDEWKELLDTFQFVLQGIRRNNNENNAGLLKELLKNCEEQTNAGDNRLYPNESRYPILRAASLLSKKDKMLLLNTLIEPENAELMNLKVADSIVLMLLDVLPKETVDKILTEWIDRQAPYVKGRRVWKFAAEIWNAGGGLGRVLQFHGIAMRDILAKAGVPLAYVEPRYYRNKQGERLNYNSIFGVDETSPQDQVEREIMRFNVRVGNDDALAVCYRSIKNGIEFYTIEGFKTGQDPAKDAPYYTEQLYNYRQYWTHPDEQHLVTREEFSVFFALAGIELSRRVEEGIRNQDHGAWKEPILHWNDGQMGFGPYFLKKRYENDPILGGALVAFTTHTYFNRQFFVQRDDWGAGNETDEEKFLRQNGIDTYDEWLYFHHRMDMWGDDAGQTYKPVCDQTSAGLRSADWRGGVAHEHVYRLYQLGYDTYKDIRDKGINVEIIGVTNGDYRKATAQEFDRAMREACGEKVDYEEPTYKQVFAAKARAKERLNERCGVNIDTKRPVLEYSGRGVSEKSGGQRALTNNNIMELVKMGVQVVIGCNTQAEKNIVANWEKLIETIHQKKAEHPDEYTGNFILIKDSNVEIQRYILAAADVQVQDSDPITEAAGFAEADIFACGGIQIAPPQNEGNLQSSGVPFNSDKSGEGNVLRPDIKIEEDSYKKFRKPYDPKENAKVEAAYLALYKTLFYMGRSVDDIIHGKNMEKTLEVLAKYGATSRRLSRVLDARLTAAEELRQWSNAIKEKSIRRTGKAPSLSLQEAKPVLAGAVKNNLDTLITMIHDINMKSYPSVEDGKTLYHVIPVELIPYSIRPQFIDMVTRLNQDYPNLKEKIEIVTDRQDLVNRITELASDPNNIVTAALTNENYLSKLPGGVKALVFKGDTGDLNSFKQIECILAALRALYQDDAKALIRLYEIASGEKFTGDEAGLLGCMNDPTELAHRIIFNLKPISVENKEMLDRLNNRVIELIRQSA